jgi:hypothetical protein
MRRIPRYAPMALAATTLLLLGACGEARAPALEEVDPPSGAGAAQPHLGSGAGEIYLSWLEPDAGGHALRAARWNGSGWDAPQTIVQRPDFFVNWADFPSVLPLEGGGLAAHWLQRAGTGTYEYDVLISRSPDSGRSWESPFRPHRDGTLSEHGFVSLFPGPEGGFGAVWLDGRLFPAAEAAGGHPEMMLRHTWVDASGRPGEDRVIDARVCDCCQTAAAITSAGPLVVYRDRSPGEIRDIYVTRWTDGAWEEGRPVHHDGWEIAACPVNGPAVAASGERVVVAWFTAARDTPQVHVAFSDDAGATFGPPLRGDDGDPLGRVDVVLLEDGSAALVWMERVGEGAQLRLRRMGAGDRPGRSVTVSELAGARASGFPRMRQAGDRLLLAWTETGEPGRLRAALAAVPQP